MGGLSHLVQRGGEWAGPQPAQSKVIDIFPKFKMAAAAMLDFQLCECSHSGVLIVWYLCSVPNLFQISVIVTKIDAHMLQTFI